MTTKTISTYVAAGYTLKARFSELDITATGGVGGTGVYSNHFATISNAGTINPSGYNDGISLAAGGYVLNQLSGVIGGFGGIAISGAGGSVTNFGTIASIQTPDGAFIDAVDLFGGGSVTNGSASDTHSLIAGYNGVFVVGAAGTVVNFGTIQTAPPATSFTTGVYLGAGGSITNGSGADPTALIEGNLGAVVSGGAGTIANFGTIGTAESIYGSGAALYGGGVITNGASGSANNADALIEGYFEGVNLRGVGTLTNFGVIASLGVDRGYGVSIGSGAVTNGASGQANALIEGVYGVSVAGIATVTNFGTILGTGGTAVQFLSSSDKLVVEAGSTFVGAVLGAGGTLVLDTGRGTLTGLLAGGNVTVSGSMATTTFSNFATVKIGSTATFASSGAVIIAAGQTVIDAGSLTLGGSKSTVVNAGLIEATGGLLTIKGAIDNTGTLAAAHGALTVMGAVTGSGTATVSGATLDFAAAFTENVAFAGKTGILELARSRGYTGTISGFSKTGGTSLDLDDIGFVSSTEATFSGTTKSGTLTVTDGVHTANIKLRGDYTASTFVAASDGHGGVIIHDPAPASASGGLPSTPLFIAAMAGMGASGAGPSFTLGEWRRPLPPMLAHPTKHIA